MKIVFSRQIFENSQISNFMKIRQLVAELFLADGRTDVTTLIVAFLSSVNAPKNKLHDDTYQKTVIVSCRRF
jgi:hypothetical protein